MNKIRQRKLIIFILFAVGISIAFSLILFSLRQNLNVFVTPKDLLAMHNNTNAAFRLGGVVKPGSVQTNRLLHFVTFVVTDFQHEVMVRYSGMLPDLFREGKGVIAEGRMLQEGYFKASTVLAKHDENYMPKSTYLALSGRTKK